MQFLTLNDYPDFLSLFREFIQQTSPISDDSWAKMVDIMNVCKVEKGMRLLDHQCVESSVRFLGKGVVKCEDHYNDKSFVYDFRVAPIVLSETVSFFNGVPSRITLEAVTDCYFLELPREPFMDIISKNLDVSMFATLGVANYLAMTHYKQCLLRTLKGEERYRHFLKEFGPVIKHLKLEDVASYIDIQQSSLSRIRRNICWENDNELQVWDNELKVVHCKTE